MTHVTYIGLGANLENRIMHLKEAIDRIDQIPECRVRAVSPFYQTEPVGVRGQKWYVNGVIRVETSLGPGDLLKSLLDIEADMGRIRQTRWGPRVIDLDILLFEDQIIQEKEVTIPHPRMQERRFVLVPLTRLAPNLIHPVLGKTMMELLHEAPEADQAVLEMGG